MTLRHFSFCSFDKNMLGNWHLLRLISSKYAFEDLLKMHGESIGITVGCGFRGVRIFRCSGCCEGFNSSFVWSSTGCFFTSLLWFGFSARQTPSSIGRRCSCLALNISTEFFFSLLFGLWSDGAIPQLCDWHWLYSVEAVQALWACQFQAGPTLDRLSASWGA